MPVNAKGDDTLVIHRGALGDLLAAVPCLRALRTCAPTGSIVLVSQRAGGVLLRRCGLVDAVADMDSAELAPVFGGSPDRVPASWSERFRRAVAWTQDPNGDLHQTLRALGVEQILIAPPFAPPPASVPHAEYLAGILRSARLPVDTPGPPLPVHPEERTLAGQWLQAHLGASDAPIVVMHPGSGSPTKNWPLAAFRILAMALQEHAGCRILIARGPAEMERLGRVELDWADAVADGLPLPLLSGLAGHCAVWVGNDAGTTHLAAWLGVPTVALFGPASDRVVWRPLGRDVTLVEATCGAGAEASAAEIESVYRTMVSAVARGAAVCSRS